MIRYSLESAKDVAQVAADKENLDLKSGACLVSIDIRGCCGQATLPEAKAVIQGEELDSSLVTGTTLQWFPKPKLKFVNKYVQQANRTMNAIGVQFSKGLTLIPLLKLPELIERLDEMQQSFIDEVDEICENYDDILYDFKEDNQEVAEYIEALRYQVTDFRGRFVFTMTPPMAVSLLFDEDVAEESHRVVLTLWDEVAEAAEALYQNSFIGKERISQKAVSAVKKLRGKLLSLSFLHDGIDTVIDGFDNILSSLPDKGYVEGNGFNALAHFVLQMSDAERLRMIAEGVSQFVNSDDDSVEDHSEIDDDFDQSIPLSAIEQKNDTPLDTNFRNAWQQDGALTFGGF